MRWKTWIFHYQAINNMYFHHSRLFKAQCPLSNILRDIINLRFHKKRVDLKVKMRDKIKKIPAHRALQSKKRVYLSKTIDWKWPLDLFKPLRYTFSNFNYYSVLIATNRLEIGFIFLTKGTFIKDVRAEIAI